MKITILVYGSLGDVQPYVALGAGLQRVGHQVRVGADPSYETLVRSHGLELAPVAGDPRDVLESEAGQTVADGDAGIVRRLAAYRTFHREMREHIATNLRDSWACARESEAVIFSFNAFAGFHVAEALGVPAFAVSIAPFTRTGSMPSINFASRPRLGAAYNLCTHTLTERLFFMPPASHAINAWRVDTLGLAPLPARGYVGDLRRSSRVPVLYSFSPELVPKASDWPDWVHVTGYWFSESDPHWKPPRALLEFLEAGPAPVFVGFGSMGARPGGRSPRETVELVCAALERAGLRGVLSIDERLPADLPLSKSVVRVGSLPHEWLFPRVAMTVHHGGSGTTAQSARAGVPMLITPFMWDQPFWGRRIAELGLGPSPIPHGRLTVENLSRALRETTQNVAMRGLAYSLGERVRRENGVETAVALIEKSLVAARQTRRVEIGRCR